MYICVSVAFVLFFSFERYYFSEFNVFLFFSEKFPIALKKSVLHIELPTVHYELTYISTIFCFASYSFILLQKKNAFFLSLFPLLFQFLFFGVTLKVNCCCNFFFHCPHHHHSIRFFKPI